MWLNKSLNHELTLRGVEKHSEFQFWHNYLNISQALRLLPDGHGLPQL